MGDLISRSSLIETLRNPTTFEELLEVTLEDFSNLINEQPTAYNVGKVVAELEELEQSRLEMYDWQGQSVASDAIDIVKRGGADNEYKG